ncbi:MAG: flippase-like domain-containing protein [Thermogladius sp.]|nr:flippase-like domain-containing protein [Thermogladius sp.]
MSWKSVVSLIIVFTTILLYSLFTSGYTALASIPLPNMVMASALLMAGYLLASVRLMIIHARYTGRRLPLIEYYKARLAGNLAAFLTPSAVGGELGRAGYLALKGFSFTEMLAVAYFEVFFDVVFTSLAALVFSFSQLPWSLPVALTAGGSIAAWVAASLLLFYTGRRYGGNAGSGVRRFKGLLGKLTSWALTLSVAFWNTSSRVKFVDLLAVVALTLLAQVLQASSVLPLLGGLSPDYVGEAFRGYFYSQALSSLPSPGGAIVSEYGLSLSLAPGYVVAYRLVYALTNVVPGLIIVYRAHSVKEEGGLAV